MRLAVRTVEEVLNRDACIVQEENLNLHVLQFDMLQGCNTLLCDSSQYDCFFIYGSFNDAVNTGSYIVLNGRIICE